MDAFGLEIQRCFVIGPVSARCVLTTVCQRSIDKARVLQEVFQKKYSWCLMMGTSTVFQKNYTAHMVLNTKYSPCTRQCRHIVRALSQDAWYTPFQLGTPSSSGWESMEFHYCSSQPFIVHWANGIRWVALSFLVRLFGCRPAMLTPVQISFLVAPEPQTHTFSESLW